MNEIGNFGKLISGKRVIYCEEDIDFYSNFHIYW